MIVIKKARTPKKVYQLGHFEKRVGYSRNEIINVWVPFAESASASSLVLLLNMINGGACEPLWEDIKWI